MKPELRALCCLAALACAPARVSAQAPVDTAGLAEGPYAGMSMLYERTFLQVDVLRLWMRFGPETSRELEELARAGAGEARLAEAAMASRNALIHSRFLRHVSLDQFLEGVHDNLDLVERAGLIDAAQHATIRTAVDTQYAVLIERGIREGDEQWYRVRGDTLDVVLRATTGEVLLSDRVVGPERRLAVLGGYLANGSDFRAKLVASLGRPDGKTPTASGAVGARALSSTRPRDSAPDCRACPTR